jgi:hypothetical protein
MMEDLRSLWELGDELLEDTRPEVGAGCCDLWKAAPGVSRPTCPRTKRMTARKRGGQKKGESVR